MSFEDSNLLQSGKPLVIAKIVLDSYLPSHTVQSLLQHYNTFPVLVSCENFLLLIRVCRAWGQIVQIISKAETPLWKLSFALDHSISVSEFQGTLYF
jgi:hypothetical protein